MYGDSDIDRLLILKNTPSHQKYDCVHDLFRPYEKKKEHHTFCSNVLSEERSIYLKNYFLGPKHLKRKPTNA
ncbi:hypothetical protein ANN_23530 [Periplaneta americana]|uniref:Uncharacterized protein n=1 Tax=Periplaneta americana TaxID=6978 RepID=A0ABQ8SLS9_PERAM|nr:hypothetical protein ANN_23530 [Periplaneta americana]